MLWDNAVTVWDALMEEGRQFDLHPAGMLALDVARIEAGLLLIEVDYISSKKALIESQKYSPYELGFKRMVHLEKEHFIGREALIEEQRRGPKRQFVGLEVDWSEVEKFYDAVGLAPQAPGTASRVAVPTYKGGKQVGKATSTTWSPTLKKMIALASVDSPHAAIGGRLQMELTVEAVRHRVGVTLVTLPFFNPPRKTATPAA
jgi:aminomethyltransferase